MAFGAVTVARTPGTDWRQPRYATDAATARTSTTTTKVRDFVRDRDGTPG
jgi:hypothetical protein